MSPRTLLLALGIGCLAPGSDAAPTLDDTMVYRCIAGGRVAYQDAPCQAGARSVVIYIAGDARAAMKSAARSAESVAQDGATPRQAAGLGAALARIRVGMSTRDLEALDPRLRTSFTRRLEANGHRHEWRYVSDDCVVHVADGVVVAVYR